jgi:lysophospholipase L1-like esterase
MRFIIIILLFSLPASGQMYFGRIVTSGGGGGESSGSDTMIGPSLAWSGKTIMFCGDSWIAGVAASPTSNRWSTLFAAGKSGTESNNGSSGATMSPDSCAGYISYSLGLVPSYTSSYRALFIALGLNDIGKNVNYQSADRFDSAYNAFLNTVINTKGWPDSLVYLVTPGRVLSYTSWTGTCGITAANTTRHELFNSKIQALATTWGCNYVDVYTPMNAASLNSSYYGDDAHLNNAGHDWLADWLLAHIR